jgi:hypothetical protein
MKDYTLYVAAAYIIAFAVLGGVTISTIIGWRKVK